MAAWILCTALLAAAASPTAGRTLPPSTSEHHGERAAYISQATALYNSEDDEDTVYRLLGVPSQDISHDSGNITFIIKQTECLKSSEKDEKCPFKKDGIVKKCTAPPPGPEGKLHDVQCHTVDSSDETTKSEEDETPKPARNHRVYNLLTGKNREETNFLQFDNRRFQPGHAAAAASCLSCIFDFLNINGR
ncbi:cathelicidin-1-like isoform X1 [Dendropsophus ebraccatus]|uniref:cathelicidin-1-like isoform X1 n=1 Tax=Dendropsophus ebraccatus TaxID=150705 RepID=UPI0038322419